MSRLRHLGGSLAGEHGFTLIELLISISLLALLSVALYQSLNLGLHAWRTSRDKISGTNEVRLVQSFMRTEIEDAYPLLRNARTSDARIDFDGEPNRIRFLAPALQANGGAGFDQVELQRTNRKGQVALDLSMRPELADPGTPAAHDVLLDGLSGLAFSYFGSDPAGAPRRWHDRWTHNLRLPLLVRIAARFAPGTHRQWPSFIVAPKIGGDEACQYDPITKGCG